jgi:hypothetical protein
MGEVIAPCVMVSGCALMRIYGYSLCFSVPHTIFLAAIYLYQMHIRSPALA